MSAVKNKFFKDHTTLRYISVKRYITYVGGNKILDSDEVDDKQLDILDCNCVKTVKRLRASSWKISVLRTENSAVNTRTICLPSIHIYIKC